MAQLREWKAARPPLAVAMELAPQPIPLVALIGCIYDPLDEFLQEPF